MAASNDSVPVTLLTCDDLAIDPDILNSQNVHLYATFMAVAAIAVGLDSLRTTPSLVIRCLLSAALALNLCLATLNWAAWIYPFNCEWYAYRTFEYFWTVLGTSQCMILGTLSICRALSVFGKSGLRYRLMAVFVAAIPTILNAIMEIDYFVKIVDTDTLLNAEYNQSLSNARYTLSYVIEAGSLLCIVAKILITTYKTNTGNKSAFRTAWMLISVVCRLSIVITFYALGSQYGNLLYSISYSTCDSILLIMISIDEVRFKAFFAPGKPHRGTETAGATGKTSLQPVATGVATGQPIATSAHPIASSAHPVARTP